MFHPGARAAEMLRLCAAYSANPSTPIGCSTSWASRPSPTPRSAASPAGSSNACHWRARWSVAPSWSSLDEPTAGLDAHARLLVWDLIAALRTDGVSVLLTTHMLDEAEHLADDIVIIDAGRVVAAGTPAELTARDHAGLRFTAVGDLDITAAAAVVSAACGGATTTRTRGEDGGYTLIGPATPEAIAALAAWCAESGVLITELHAAGQPARRVPLPHRPGGPGMTATGTGTPGLRSRGIHPDPARPRCGR